MRKHNYVVGYIGEGQVVYGKDESELARYVTLLTLSQARKSVKRLKSPNVKSVVYKLVKVKR